jgi:hypothetical protein
MLRLDFNRFSTLSVHHINFEVLNSQIARKQVYMGTTAVLEGQNQSFGSMPLFGASGPPRTRRLIHL